VAWVSFAGLVPAMGLKLDPPSGSVVVFHNSHPPFMVEAAHVPYKPQVFCNEHGPIQ